MTIVVEEFAEIEVHSMCPVAAPAVLATPNVRPTSGINMATAVSSIRRMWFPFVSCWGPKRAPPNAHKPKPVASRGSEPSRALQVLPHIQVRTGFTFFFCYECPRPPVRCSTAHLRDTRASRR